MGFFHCFHHFFDVCGEGSFTIFFFKLAAVAFWWEVPKIETGLDCLEREVIITLCTIANTFFVVFVLILVVVDVVHTVPKEINFKLDLVVHLVEDGVRGGVTFRIKDGVVLSMKLKVFPCRTVWCGGFSLVRICLIMWKRDFVLVRAFGYEPWESFWIEVELEGVGEEFEGELDNSFCLPFLERLGVDGALLGVEKMGEDEFL